MAKNRVILEPEITSGDLELRHVEAQDIDRAAPEVLAKVRAGLARETSGVVKGIMARTGCDMERAIDAVLKMAGLNLIRLLLQPNGEVLIDVHQPPKVITEAIVDSETNIIMKGRTTIERDFDKAKGVSGRTTVEIKK